LSRRETGSTTTEPAESGAARGPDPGVVTGPGGGRGYGTRPWVRDLAARVRLTPGLAVLTGGQTGVDTAAALAALRAGLPVHVAFPAGLRQEDGPLTEARRRALRGAVLHELPSATFAERTWACVSLADAVALIDPAGGEGCEETARAAAVLARPLLRLGAGSVRPGAVAEWLERQDARVLQVAGCRGSLLAGSGTEPLARSLVAAIVAGARLRHRVLTGADAAG